MASCVRPKICVCVCVCSVQLRVLRPRHRHRRPAQSGAQGLGGGTGWQRAGISAHLARVHLRRRHQDGALRDLGALERHGVCVGHGGVAEKAAGATGSARAARAQAQQAEEAATAPPPQSGAVLPSSPTVIGGGKHRQHPQAQQPPPLTVRGSGHLGSGLSRRRAGITCASSGADRTRWRACASCRRGTPVRDPGRVAITFTFHIFDGNGILNDGVFAGVLSTTRARERATTSR